jgi:hypothetical protein
LEKRGEEMMGTKQETPSGTYQWEASLHRAWEGLHFDRRQLITTDHQPLRIHHPGTLNHDQGPDFLNASIQIGKARHFGHVELHLNADDWVRHGHHCDPHYDAVMLHVFLVGGRQVALRADGTPIPELCLKDRIAPAMQPQAASTLPCSGLGRQFLPQDPGKWLETAGIRRLMDKAKGLHGTLLALQYDWSQLIWEEMAAVLGGPVNAQCFRQLARHAHWGVVRKYVFARDCLEAILFGSCGMLEGPARDAYHGMLKECWEFLQQKHGLKMKPIPFKFHRMHPAGFPQVRIAQLAMLAATFRPICQLVEVGTLSGFSSEWTGSSEYWAFRHDFGNSVGSRRMELGAETRHRLVMNALAPLCLLDLWEGKFPGKSGLEGSGLDPAGMGGDWEKLLQLLRELPPEANRITRKFLPLGLSPRDALQAQGMVGLYKEKCLAFRCLDCEVGRKAILGPSLD